LDPAARSAIQLLFKRGATYRVVLLSVLSELTTLMATFVISFAFRLHQKHVASGAIVSATCDAMVRVGLGQSVVVMHIFAGIIYQPCRGTAALECTAIRQASRQPVQQVCIMGDCECWSFSGKCATELCY